MNVCGYEQKKMNHLNLYIAKSLRYKVLVPEHVHEITITDCQRHSPRAFRYIVDQMLLPLHHWYRYPSNREGYHVVVIPSNPINSYIRTCSGWLPLRGLARLAHFTINI